MFRSIEACLRAGRDTTWTTALSGEVCCVAVALLECLLVVSSPFANHRCVFASQLRDFEKTFASERAKFIESQQKPKSSGSKLKKKKSKDGDVDKASDATGATSATAADAKKACVS